MLSKRQTLLNFALACCLLLIIPLMDYVGLAEAACANTPDTSQGTDTQTINVATAGTYYIWSRILPPDTTNNSYYLQIDGGCAINVGDSSNIPASSWTWVNYQNATPSSVVSANLTAGTHTIVMTGREPNVGIDRLLLLGDPACVPTGNGSNCTPVPDTTPPTVSIATPANGATVSGTTTITANASDNVGVSSVQFKLDGSNLGAADTSAPYSYTWDTTQASNGTHMLTAVAFDGTNTTTASAVTVTVNNTSSSPTPTSVQNFTWNTTTKTLSWSAYSGAASYEIAQVHNPNVSSTATNYRTPTDYSWPHIAATSCIVGSTCNIPTPASGETVNYGILPFNSSGQPVTGATWAKEITVIWPTTADTTPPSQPQNLKATAASSSQINLSWTASTDNVGVSGYQIYRGSSTTPIATVSTTSYGDSGLAAATSYSYHIVAIDAAKNVSQPSATASATTHSAATTLTVTGAVTNNSTSQAISGAHVTSYIYGTTGSTISAYTNSQGQYVLANITPNTPYYYHYSAQGYRSQTYKNLSFPAGIITKNVSLQHR